MSRERPLGGKQTFATIDPQDLDIHGTPMWDQGSAPNQRPLSEVREQILAVRAAAAAEKGWMLDTYLLRPR